MYKHVIKKSNRHIFNRKKFISDKLDHILSPAAKEYLKLEKDVKEKLLEKAFLPMYCLNMRGSTTLSENTNTITSDLKEKTHNNKSTIKILANDGLSSSGIDLLTEAGFEVITTNIAQEQLIPYINDHKISVLLVRSATTARKELIDSCTSLKIIGRGGVGMDNIDVEYAREKGLNVINTPAASSSSVAELVFSHLFGGVRFLFESNRSMPLEGESNFKSLKKSYAKGIELRGKTIGIIGFGRIGQEVAKIALGIGMNVLATDKYSDGAEIEVSLLNGASLKVSVETISIENVLKQSDFISLHVPAQKDYVIGSKEISMMKNGAAIINVARGGVIDEDALVSSLDNNKLAFACLDTFEKEPKPEVKLLTHPKISLTPHIGAATLEAQDRIGVELGEQIISILENPTLYCSKINKYA